MSAGVVVTGTCILVADNGNHRVKRWRQGLQGAGEVVFGGHGAGPGLNQLDGPTGMAVEKDGSLVVADALNDRVLRVREGAAAGEVVAGGHADEGAACTTFDSTSQRAHPFDTTSRKSSWHQRHPETDASCRDLVLGGASERYNSS